MKKMLSVPAYYDGKNYVPTRNILVRQNQKVIITVLDDFIPQRKKKSLEEIKSYMRGGKSVPQNITTVDYIRQLRED